MKRSILRTLACVAWLGLPVAAKAQAPAISSLPDFTAIVQRNAPAVVHVEAKYSGKNANAAQLSPGQGGMPDDPQDDILRRFFGMPMMPSPEDEKHTSLGSGFIISPDGYILTNNHVVDGADQVTVRLQDRRTFTAKVVGTDPKYDIALLKVQDHDSLPAVTIGDSRSLKPGQWVLAIGSPFGFDYTVTQGIVSAVGRNLGQQDQPYTSFIQTDVPINRGNSGGPLFNLQGQVVGVNSQIYSSSGGYQGVAFSIPIDVAMNAVEQIRSKGYVSRGMLGVQVQTVTDDMVKALKLDSGSGAMVASVSPGSGAEKAGIQVGDVILAYDGQTLQQASDLPPLVGMTKPGTTVPVQLLRNGRKETIEVKVGEMPRDQKAIDSMQAAAAATPSNGASALGLAVQAVDADTRQQMGLKSGQGVQIGRVSSQAALQAGLQPGQVILMVDQQKVGSVEAFQAATRNMKPGDTVLLLVTSGDQSGFVALTVPDRH